MKFIVDMNLSPRWVDLLIAAGYQAVHWSNLGPVTAPDSQIMHFAKANGFSVLTHDLDFGAILPATQGEKPSVVQIRAENVNPDTIGSQVVAALRQTQSDLAQGALLTIDTNRTRLSLLPLIVRP